jgi:hypothetical protein
MLRFIIPMFRLISGTAHHEGSALYPHKTGGRGILCYLLFVPYQPEADIPVPKARVGAIPIG